MKKVIFYFIFVFALGCTSDEELTEEKSLDPIIGKWHFYSSNIADVETVYDECKQKGYFLFLKNGTGEFVQYSNNPPYGCILDETKNLQWSFNGSEYDIKTFSGGSYAGIISFGITRQYFGEISDNFLKIPVGYTEIIYFINSPN
jgi:hypothetical protein